MGQRTYVSRTGKLEQYVHIVVKMNSALLYSTGTSNFIMKK
jgi:hypothetical protein